MFGYSESSQTRSNSIHSIQSLSLFFQDSAWIRPTEDWALDTHRLVVLIAIFELLYFWRKDVFYNSKKFWMKQGCKVDHMCCDEHTVSSRFLYLAPRISSSYNLTLSLGVIMRPRCSDVNHGYNGFSKLIEVDRDAQKCKITTQR